MKKIIILLIISFTILMSSNTFADDSGDTSIPTYTIEQLMILSKSKQAKVDIIKKNNVEIENCKTNLNNQILKAANEINDLKIEITENTAIISNEKLDELKSLLEFIKDSTKTLNEDATNVSNEINAILDLILSKSMKLEQYDKIIEKQNELIVKMKNILANVEKI